MQDDYSKRSDVGKTTSVADIGSEEYERARRG